MAWILVQSFILAAIATSIVKAGSATDAMKEAMMEIAQECMKTNPISDDEKASLHKHELPDSPAVHCFMACVLKTPGLIGDDSMVDAEAAVGMIKEMLKSDPDLAEKASNLIKHCAAEANSAEVTSADKSCGRAAIAFVCLRDNKEKFGIGLIE